MLTVLSLKITNIPCGLNFLKTMSVADSSVAFGLLRFFSLKAVCVIVFCQMPLEIFVFAAARDQTS